MSLEQLSAAQRHRAIAVVFASTFITLAGFFMLMPLVILKLTERGLPPAVVGLFSATMWLGIFLATPFAGRFVARIGRRAAFLTSAFLPALAAIGIALTDVVALWFALILLDGMASGVRWVLSEATVAEAAPPHRRGLIVGLFETMVGATFVVGPVLLQFTGTEGTQAFWWAAALSVLGFALTCALPALPAPDEPADAAASGLRALWRAAAAFPVVMVMGFVGGFFESGTAGLLPLMGLALGWAAATAALLVAASGLGSALAMAPAGALADQFGLPLIQRVCAVLTLLGCLLLPLTAQWPAVAWAVAFAWGGAGGALYTMAMIDIGHRLRGVALIHTTAVLVMAYTLGGMLAPPTGGLAMQLAPIWGLPIWLTTVAGLGLWALWFQRGPEPVAPAEVLQNK